MGFPLTEEQRAVVEDRGGGLLVAAAAGSGKTRVLVERLLRRVQEEGADIDRFLVITYTKAAAAELRGRIAQELSVRLAETPGDRHLRRQAMLLYKTQISTIHAFCAQLLREHGHLLDLEADLRLCDESEAGVLMLQAMDQVLEERYDAIQPGSDFACLLDTMSTGRDDSRLVEIALDIYNKVQSHPDPHTWLEAQGRAFDLEGVTDAGETVWGRLLLGQAREQVGYWRIRMGEALALCEGDEKLSPVWLRPWQTWRPLRPPWARAGTGQRSGLPSPSLDWARCGAVKTPPPRSGSRPSGRPARSGWASWRSVLPTAAASFWRTCGRWRRRCGGCLPWWRIFPLPIPPSSAAAGCWTSPTWSIWPSGSCGRATAPPRSWPGWWAAGTSRLWWTSTRTPTRRRT